MILWPMDFHLLRDFKGGTADAMQPSSQTYQEGNDRPMDFHETRMGHNFFEHQLPELIKALNRLSATLSGPVPASGLPVSPDPKFLHDLYFDRYVPEVFEVQMETRQLNQAVSQARKTLVETLPEESKKKLEVYEAALSERNTDLTELAYESGVRAAVQIIMAGLSLPVPPAPGEDKEAVK